MKAAVLGAGSWGTTFALVLADAGTPVTIWARSAEMATAITTSHENPRYLPGIPLPASLTATDDAAEAVDGADLVVFAVTAQTLRACLEAWAPLIPPQTLLVSLIKGIELGSLKRMSEVIMETLDVPPHRVAVVSGPNLAREIAQRQVAASVVACTDEPSARLLQRSCHTGYFRPYWNTDVIGCELGGAVKNIITVAVGIAVALGLGDNTKATLITRGLAEMAQAGRGARGRPADVRRAGRAGRPGGQLQLAAVAEPDLRPVPGAGHELRAGPRGDQADGRGGHLATRRCSSWPASTGSRCRSPRSSPR